MNILMVCLGNICRSPMAEGLLKHKVLQKQLDWTIDSAGMTSWHQGTSPDRRAIEEMTAHGIDISQQRSRPFVVEDFERFDVVYAMDASNYIDILSLSKTEEHRDKVRLILNEIDPEKNRQVPDPYYGEYGFEKVYKLLDKATDAIIEKYAKSYKP